MKSSKFHLREREPGSVIRKAWKVCCCMKGGRPFGCVWGRDECSMVKYKRNRNRAMYSWAPTPTWPSQRCASPWFSKEPLPRFLPPPKLHSPAQRIFSTHVFDHFALVLFHSKDLRIHILLHHQQPIVNQEDGRRKKPLADGRNGHNDVVSFLCYDAPLFSRT